MAQTIGKVWGSELVLFNGPLCGKILRVKPGFQCSLHYHPVKQETFFVLRGECVLQTSMVTPPMGHRKVLKRWDSFHIPPGLPHRFASVKGCTLLEVSTHHEDSDVVRIEPSGVL